MPCYFVRGNIVREIFGKTDECLDIYHALEHVSACGNKPSRLYKTRIAHCEHNSNSSDVPVPDNRLRKQRPHLIGCLHELSAEPTNNRALRPAVIARKISCGNKTDRGRQTWQVLASLAATCVQRGEDLIDYLATHLRLPEKGEEAG